ncbi:hypothetical protein ACP275_02G062900 [Erythranthe tilingii]
MERRFRHWDNLNNFHLHTAGRILIVWNPDVARVELVDMTTQVVHCKVTCMVTHRLCYVSFVYKLFTPVTRRPLWQSLMDFGTGLTSPWLCLGDFNVVLKPTEKSGGNVLTPYLLNDIQDCFRHSGLEDLPSTGFHYTWTNQTVWSKLDRALVNQSWRDEFEGSSAQFLPFGAVSDHTPIIVKLGGTEPPASRPFRFFNMWTQHDDFQHEVREVWSSNHRGSRQWAVCKNLKALKHPLKRLNRREFGHISERVKQAGGELEEIQQAYHNDPHNPQLCGEMLAKVERFRFLAKAEKSFFYQKAKLHYLRDTDRTTKFFHGIAKRNAKRNNIVSLRKEDGSVTTSRDEVLAEFEIFYKNFLGTRVPCEPVDPHIIATGPVLGEEDRASLIQPVTDVEIREALFDIADDKAPGPDGYTTLFFKAAWSTVGPLLTEAALEFFRSGELLKQWDNTVLVFIPKSAQA